MVNPQVNCSWIKERYQEKTYQSEIFIGYNITEISDMTIMIESLVEGIDLSFFSHHYNSNEIIGGRPNVDYRIMLKLYLYLLYNGISSRKLAEHYSLGSNLHYLVHGLGFLPKKSTISDFLKILDLYIDRIFDLSIEFIESHIDLDKTSLYCDGTIFEAHNSRNKIITDYNLERSNRKHLAILANEDSDEETKIIALTKLELNQYRATKLALLQRQSYGRTDEDSVILMNKNGSYIAGYNAQFVEEANHGVIVFTHLSNRNPDSEVFKEMFPVLAGKFEMRDITFDAGYGTTEILVLLSEAGIKPIVTPRKGKNKIIPDSVFILSENAGYLTCPKNRRLLSCGTNDKGLTRFKSSNCSDCEFKTDCTPRLKNRTITLNIKEYLLIKEAQETIATAYGKEKYSHRKNICESPHGFIFYNLKGKKLKMIGLARNNTIVKLYAILYNLSRLLSLKST